jgi:hypothetical protein
VFKSESKILISLVSDKPCSSTKFFTDFGKLNFLMVVSVLGSSQFSILPQLPPKILLDSKVVRLDPKIII